METFKTILTQYGRDAIADFLITQVPVKLVSVAAGDGGGSYYTPDEAQTALKNEIWRGQTNDLFSLDNIYGDVVAEVIIPPEAAPDGGWYIREVGIFDDTGHLFAVGQYPLEFQPDLSTGAAKQIYIRIIIEVGNTAAIEIVVDHSLALASKADIDNLQTQITTTQQDIEGIRTQIDHAVRFLTPEMFTGLYATTQEALQACCDAAKAKGLPVMAWGYSGTLTSGLNMDSVKWMGGELRGNNTITAVNTSFDGVRFNGARIALKGGAFYARNITMVNQTSTAQIIIQDLISDSSIEILDSKFQKGNYGILHQGSSGAGFKVTKGRIARVDFNDMNGDAIELNLVNKHYQGGGMLIEDILLDNINNRNNQPNWGIGIGIAGSGSYSWNSDDNFASNITVRNIRARNTRQCIHFEKSRDFTVENVEVFPDSTKSTSSGLDAAGVVTYGCTDFTIKGVTGEPATENGRMVFIAWGVNNGAYAAPSRNFNLSGIVTRTGSVLIMTAARDASKNEFLVSDIEAKTVTLQGLGSRMVIRNIKTQKFTGTGNDGKPFSRNDCIEAVITDITSTGEDGTRTGEYTTLYADRLVTHGCNFDVTQMAQFGGTRGVLLGNVGNTYNAPDNNFPAGREFCRNDVINKKGGGKFIVTRSGAFIAAGDLIRAAAAGQDFIESTNAKPWGLAAGKSAGTRIVIPGGGVDGSDHVAVITRSPVAVSGYYRVSITPPLVVAVATGTEIRAATPINLNDGFIEVA
ncbi:MAG: phage tail protein [Citrobacter sp.]|uniref:phage tail-collar fiber domain-containing protein n=1 Tax=Citrobacter sp. TaxID=1896336 RepID=UPI002FCA8B38